MTPILVKPCGGSTTGCPPFGGDTDATQYVGVLVISAAVWGDSVGGPEGGGDAHPPPP